MRLIAWFVFLLLLVLVGVWANHIDKSHRVTFDCTTVSATVAAAAFRCEAIRAPTNYSDRQECEERAERMYCRPVETH